MCVDGMVLAAAFSCSNFPCFADTQKFSSVPGCRHVGFAGGWGHPRAGCPAALGRRGCHGDDVQCKLPGMEPCTRGCTSSFPPDAAPAAEPAGSSVRAGSAAGAARCRDARQYRLCGTGQGHGKRCQLSPTGALPCSSRRRQGAPHRRLCTPTSPKHHWGLIQPRQLVLVGPGLMVGRGLCGVQPHIACS